MGAWKVALTLLVWKMVLSVMNFSVAILAVSDENQNQNNLKDISASEKLSAPSGVKQDEHGRVLMGVKQHGCDDGEWNLLIDWDVPDGKDTSFTYTCQPEETLQLREESRMKRESGAQNTASGDAASEPEPLFLQLDQVSEECLDRSTIPRPGHACMDKKIVYEDTPPRAGNHRPLWPAFGEYRFLPQARWVHALEHGAAVFLYHPCADQVGIQLMKLMAKSCLRKILVTPYRKMRQQFAIVTYGCRLMMNSFDPEAAYQYLVKHALRDAPETTPKNGTFVAELIEGSDIVEGSDLRDRCICPYWSSHRVSLEPYMSWYRAIELRVEEAALSGAPVDLTGIFMGKDVDVEKSADGCPLS